MSGQFGDNEENNMVLCFDKGPPLATPLRILEAAPPLLRATLYVCQYDGGVKLSRDSGEAWELMLHHMDPDCTSSDVADEIKNASLFTIDDVIRMCHTYEITSLEEEIDKTTARCIEAMDPCSQRQPRPRGLDYIHVNLEDRSFEIVRDIEMVKSEQALARYLVQVIKTNEKRLETRVARGMSTDEEGWESAMERIHDFIKEMHNAKRYRFCSCFAERCMSERVNTSLSSILDQSL